MCKVGFAGEDKPQACFPAIVGIPKDKAVMCGKGYKQFYIGEDAQTNRGILKIEYPLENGIVTNWDYMEKIWRHAYDKELQTRSEEHPLLMTEAPMNPFENRHRMCQIAFESLNVPGFYLSVQAVLSLYSTGRTTGLVFDSGDGVSHIVPIYEGYAISSAIKRMNLAGRELSRYFVKLLTERGMNIKSTADCEIVREIKEKMCYVSLDYAEDMKKPSMTFSKNYELPDGTFIAVENERFRCPEVLFQPTLIGSELQGIHDACFGSIVGCSQDLRRELYANVVLSGGTTLFPNLADRLRNEISKKVPAVNKIKVIANPDRKYSVWCGASILASLSTFQQYWITRQQYQEVGPAVINNLGFDSG